MRFTFSTTAIASISGATLLATLTSHEVAASTSFPYKPFNTSFGLFKPPAKTQRSECSFVNSFKGQEIHPDIGILSCRPGMTCVEDATSSVGGRCVALMNAVAHVNVEPAISCNFANGTAGIKCYGLYACNGFNETRVGCGSCIGDLSCFYLVGDVTVGENSCVGKYSCALSGTSMESSVLTIGDNSCVGINSCKYVEGTVSSTQIGNNSCNGSSVCMLLKGTVGDDSCIEGKYVCYAFSGGIIGSGSCSQYAGCAQYGYPYDTGNIGDNSCNGIWTCNFLLASRDTGDNSCNGDFACASVTYDVGYNTCNGDYACPACYPSAQKVKLQSITGAPIQVFEVKVNSSGVNVAESKTAKQSSTYKGNPKFSASNAIDGNRNTLSHTAASSTCPSWWEVDLGGLFPIESIEILNRWCSDESDPYACLCRLSHVSLALFDDQGKFVESISVGDTCGKLEVKLDLMRSREYCSAQNRVQGN